MLVSRLIMSSIPLVEWQRLSQIRQRGVCFSEGDECLGAPEEVACQHALIADFTTELDRLAKELHGRGRIGPYGRLSEAPQVDIDSGSVANLPEHRERSGCRVASTVVVAMLVGKGGNPIHDCGMHQWIEPFGLIGDALD
ncbi:hypothetical protein BH23CHL4_BH23CHL4_08500 [soil metagenome]